MKGVFGVVALMVYTQFCFGQNLVPNPSFENYDTLPCEWVQSQQEFEAIMQNWTMPTLGTTDIMSTLVSTSCLLHCLSISIGSRGPQLPRTGDLMASFFTYGDGCGSQPNYREYLEVQLTQPLVVGETYYAEMFVSFAEKTKYATNNFGMYFSQEYIYSEFCTNLMYAPQINEEVVVTESEDWHKISGVFTATAPFEFLVIGNFFDDESTEVIYYPDNPKDDGKYYIDDISVRNIESVCLATASSHAICSNEAVLLVAYSESFIGWANSSNPEVLISTVSEFEVSPQETTTYLAYSNCDTVSVMVMVQDLAFSVDLGTDTICLQDSVLLDATVLNATYLWQDSSTAATLSVDESGFYNVSVSKGVCTVTDSVLVTTEDCEVSLELPNVFTPNGDGINEILQPLQMNKVVSLSTSIYNRWGHLVFVSDNLTIDWDGTTLNGITASNGVYFWTVTYFDASGTEYRKSGNVTLLR